MKPRHLVCAAITACFLTANFFPSAARGQTPANSAAPGIVPTKPPQFGNQHVGTTSEPQSIELTNNSGAQAKLKIGASSIPDFVSDKTDCDRELDAGQTCLLVVRFSPKVADAADTGTPRTGTVEIGYEGDDKKPTTTLTLNGTALPPYLGLTPKQITFPQQSASATSSSQMVTLTNLQANPQPPDAATKNDILVNQIAAGGDFTVDAPTLPHTLKPGQSMSFAVHYAPKQEDTSSGVLLVTTADGNELSLPLAGSTYQLLGGLCSPSHPHREFQVILVVAIIYWLAMVIVRWHRIANPTRELLRGEIATVRAELDLLPFTLPGAQPSPTDWKADIADILLAAGLEVSPKVANPKVADPKLARKKWYNRLANFLFWSRGQEIVGWGYLHDAQEKMAFHQPPAVVVARLETAAERLKNSTDKADNDLATTIEAALNPAQNPGGQNATGQNTAGQNTSDRLQALLAEALSAINDREDTEFAKMAGWQNKASWLVGCGLFIILVLTIAIPQHAILFVVGGAGGLISRMSRSLNRKDVPTDYGASWTTLFLSPVSGALGAWAGILIAELAVKLDVLGPLFQADFTAPSCRASTLAIAFVFGFSEQLLDQVLVNVDKAGVKDSQSGQSGTTPAKGPQQPGGNQPQGPQPPKPDTNQAKDSQPAQNQAQDSQPAQPAPDASTESQATPPTPDASTESQATQPTADAPTEAPPAPTEPPPAQGGTG